MEEPEIALPPHTQRRIAKYLLTETTQCFVTSHSPYIIERFDPNQIYVLSRDESANVKTTVVALGPLKPKMYRKHSRRGLAEAMLGRGVIVAEGISEQCTLRAVADKLEAGGGCYPLDLSGVTIFPVEGDGSLASFGAFFKALGLKTYAFFDKKQRTIKEDIKLTESFDLPNETAYSGIEQLLTAEVPVSRQWEFLEAVRQSGECGHIVIPSKRPADNKISEIATSVLKGKKGHGYTADLIELCGTTELPSSITTFLAKVFADFPESQHIPLGVPTSPEAQSVASNGGGTTD